LGEEGVDSFVEVVEYLGVGLVVDDADGFARVVAGGPVEFEGTQQIGRGVDHDGALGVIFVLLDVGVHHELVKDCLHRKVGPGCTST
jgi:hypothetical protein